jgi:hypothetical protein
MDTLIPARVMYIVYFFVAFSVSDKCLFAKKSSLFIILGPPPKMTLFTQSLSSAGKDGSFW